MMDLSSQPPQRGRPSCTRPGCQSPATAVLSFSYSARTVWLHDLPTEVVPMSYALCGAHADAFGAPLGWTTEDRRRGDGTIDHPGVAV